MEIDDDNTGIFHLSAFQTHGKFLYYHHYLHIYELIIDPHNDLLPVGLIAQLVEHCTGIAEVRVQVPRSSLNF